MNSETITLDKERGIPKAVLDKSGLGGEKAVRVIYGKMGIIIMRTSTTLTDMLSGLIDITTPDWDENEYAQYLLERNK